MRLCFSVGTLPSWGTGPQCSPTTRDGQAAASALDFLNAAFRTEAGDLLDEAKVVQAQHAENATDNSRQVGDLH